MQTPRMTGAMSVEQAQAVFELLDRNGVRCWVMGGWGVDALLGRMTREHKDLDLLVLLTDLSRYADIVQQHGFERKLEWGESQPIEVAGLHFDSAFVDAHPDGQEIDVHVIDVDPQGVVTQFHTDPWPLLGPVDRDGLDDGSLLDWCGGHRGLAVPVKWDNLAQA